MRVVDDFKVNGTGEFAEYGVSFLKDAVELFEGELVISNA